MSEIVLVPVDTEEGLRWRWRCEECRTLDQYVWVFPAAALDDAEGRHHCKAGVTTEVQWGLRDDGGDSWPSMLDEHWARRFAKDGRRVVRRTVYYGPAEEVS